jgi:peptide/nickel transport system permease protein
VKAITVYLAIVTMLVNLLVDVCYKLADPRVRLE